MKKFMTLILICLTILLTPIRAKASDWETAGKILAGVVGGHIIREIFAPGHCHGYQCYPYPSTPPIIIPMPPPPPMCYEYRVYIPGYWHEDYVIELIPGYWDTVWIRKEDGTIYQDKIWIPPTTKMVPRRVWIPGRWEIRRERY